MRNSEISARMRDLQERDVAKIWHPCSQMKDYEDLPPIVIDRGEGVYLYDVDGRDYIDIVSSWWCNLLGHRHPRIRAGIKAQLDRLEHVIFANFTHEPAIRLCEELQEVIPEGLTRFNFSDNGSASVECALKMAFQYQYQTGHPEKQRFMCLEDGYHGETIGALSVGALDLYAKIYRPMLLDVIRLPVPDAYRAGSPEAAEIDLADCMRRAEEQFERYGAETCALIVEPLLQGSAGMRMYPPEYLAYLRKLCDRHGVLLIADEIATGFGRTGTMFACEQAGISPDLMCISKGLTGGYLPMAITITTEEIYQAFYADYNEGKAFMHSHTYSGNPLGCAAALAVLETLREERILEQARARAPYLKRRLEETFGQDPGIGEIRTLGLINALELTRDSKTREPWAAERRMGYQVYREALKEGLLLRPLGNVLYFNPPLIIDEKTIDEAVRRAERAYRRVMERECM